ncbi:MAG: hypothetical protein KGJ86_01270 [Chloroflexota bacterium]|nr:hypothetical protein [Chloroflexota bacterium]
MPIKVLGIHHANLRLQAPEQAMDFYGRVLGLERDPSLVYDPERPN